MNFDLAFKNNLGYSDALKGITGKNLNDKQRIKFVKELKKKKMN